MKMRTRASKLTEHELNTVEGGWGRELMNWGWVRSDTGGGAFVAALHINLAHVVGSPKTP